MAGKIFVNYRRGDDPGFTGRLFDRLEEAFEPERLFMDVDNIAPGLDFVSVLEEQVAQCDVLLAVIGKGWIDAIDATGARRLDKPDDFVRIEIESALKQDKRVIPVLVGEAQMPRVEQLPETMRPLARRNAVRLTHERFRADAQGLLKALQQALDDVETLRQEKVEALRQAKMDEERKREEEAANARAQALREAEEQARREKEQARLAATAGLSADQIAKAEELANWDYIKGRKSSQEFRDHLARFPGGVTERFARTRLEELVWAELGSAPGLDQLSDFLAEFPQGGHAKAAADRRTALERQQAAAEEARDLDRRETEAWAAASASGDIVALTAFLEDWPLSRHAGAARSRIDELKRVPTRRWLLQGVGGVVGVAAVGGGVIWMMQSRVPPSAPAEPRPPAEPPPPDESIRTFAGHEWVISVAVSPDGGSGLSGGKDHTLKLWELATGKELRTLTGHTDTVYSVAFSPNGRTALSGSSDKTLKLWAVETGKELRTFTGHSDWIHSVAFSPDGRTALSGGGDMTLKLWEVATGKELRTFTAQSVIYSVAFSPDGHTALSSSADMTLKLWEVATGKQLRTFTGHSDRPTSVAFSPDGRTALSGSEDGTLKLWEVATGKELRTFTVQSDIFSVAFSPKGRTALSGSKDKTLKLWEVATGKELRRFTGHSDWVLSVAFSPDARTALSGSGDGTLKLWDLWGL
jgi:WD40 repeat protein